VRGEAAQGLLDLDAVMPAAGITSSSTALPDGKLSDAQRNASPKLNEQHPSAGSAIRSQSTPDGREVFRIM
jgi:hypothetical protein